MKPNKTCQEAAKVFRERQAQSWSESDRAYYKGMAEVLEMFGDAPIPVKFWERWDLSVWPTY